MSGRERNGRELSAEASLIHRESADRLAERQTDARIADGRRVGGRQMQCVKVRWRREESAADEDELRAETSGGVRNKVAEKSCKVDGIGQLTKEQGKFARTKGRHSRHQLCWHEYEASCSVAALFRLQVYYSSCG
eukprot:6181840-Pleurochrysis_carterae.AAC.2